jgi:hypothetical protein
MPEFILDHGTPEAAREFNKLDSFTQGYIQAMFFTDEERLCEESEGDHKMPAVAFNLETMESRFVGGNSVSFADLAPATLARIIADCAAFQTANAALLEQAAELEPGSEGLRYGRNALDDERLGMLFWYARNGHGVAFTDDGDAPCLKALQAACGYGTVFPQLDTGLGDDGKIYF